MIYNPGKERRKRTKETGISIGKRGRSSSIKGTGKVKIAALLCRTKFYCKREDDASCSDTSQSRGIN
jgi:hypothetical protein